MKRNTIIAIMITFCFTASLFMIIPIRSAVNPYNPWIDVNDDGRINLQELSLLAKSYNTAGDPGTKAMIAYNSGWINITDKCGQYFNITHNLNSTDLIVDIRGKTTPDGGPHQRNYGLTEYMQGWNKTYGGTNDDGANALVQTSDGGYALAGWTTSFGAGYNDFWLLKTDASGNMQWSKTYGGTNDDGANALVQTSDGGYALAGWTDSFGAGNHDVWLVKTDASGNMQWNQTYGGTNDDDVGDLVQTSDGGYALAGSTWSFGGSCDFWLVKADASGNMQWNKTYGGTNDDFGDALVQTVDGGYAAAGSTHSFGAGSYDFWVIKTDASGTIVWNQTYGGTYDEYASALVQTSDGGYALAGDTFSFGAGKRDLWLVRTDASGNMQWNKTYGGTNDEDVGGLVQTSDGGYALGGFTRSFVDVRGDVWLVKADASGNMQWNKTYGGKNEDLTYGLVQTSDGGYALAGYTFSLASVNGDVWLVRTDASGNIGFESGLAWVDSTANTVTLYRGATDIYWNYVQVRLWMPKTP